MFLWHFFFFFFSIFLVSCFEFRIRYLNVINSNCFVFTVCATSIGKLIRMLPLFWNMCNNAVWGHIYMKLIHLISGKNYFSPKKKRNIEFQNWSLFLILFLILFIVMFDKLENLVKSEKISRWMDFPFHWIIQQKKIWTMMKEMLNISLIEPHTIDSVWELNRNNFVPVMECHFFFPRKQYKIIGNMVRMA